MLQKIKKWIPNTEELKIHCHLGLSDIQCQMFQDTV